MQQITTFKEIRIDRSHSKVNLSENASGTGFFSEVGREVHNFIRKQLSLNKDRFIIFSTTSQFNIEQLPGNYYDSIISLWYINDIQFINKFFESINSKIVRKGIFIGCAETKGQRKERIMNKFPPIINYI